MRLTTAFALPLLVASAALAAGGCRTTTALPERPPDVTGEVTQVSAVQGPDAIGSLRVEENPADSSGSAKYVLTVTPATVLVVRPGGVAEEVGFGEMVVGQRVQAWITGPVRESYPMQATASHVLVLERE
jgi:hypothetical protein